MDFTITYKEDKTQIQKKEGIESLGLEVVGGKLLL